MNTCLCTTLRREKNNTSQEADTRIVMESSATSSSSGKGKRKCIRALYAAALEGNWKNAEALVKEDCTLLQSYLTPGKDTVLHVATSANCSAFIQKLVNLENVDLTLLNENGDTAFSIAAASGFVDIAQIMVRRKVELPYLRNKNKETPLFKAVKGGHKKMARYLYPLTNIEQLEVESRNRLFVATVVSEMYDISFVMLHKDPTCKLAYARDPESKQTALHVLAQKPQGTASRRGVGTTITYIYSWICGKAFKPTSAYQLLVKIWDEVLKLEDEQILELMRQGEGTPIVLFEAVKSGNVEFVSLFVKSFPNLIREADEEGKRLLDVSILQRKEKIFNLCVSIGAFMETTHIDGEGNNMLHMAGKSSPPEMLDILPPNLQMQQEHSWFKAVEKIMSPEYINMKNKNGETPKDVFVKLHKDLIVKARTAMKETASSCMVVSTLISGIVFSAGFALCTIPDSIICIHSDSLAASPDYNSFISLVASPYSGKYGYCLGINLFMACVASNAVALFSSTTSTIMLLSILTSLFLESEHIKSLRANMKWAINALLISIVSLIIAFSSVVCLICNYHRESLISMVKYFISLVVVPAILFIFLYLRFRLGMGRI